MDLAIVGTGTLTAILVTGYYLAQSHIAYMKQHWSELRCNPLYMPFAGLVGVSVSGNFSRCMGKSFADQSAINNDGLLSHVSILSEGMGHIGGALGDIRGLLGNVRGGFMMVFQMVFGKIANLMSSMQYLMIRIRTLMGRLVGVFASLIYSAQTGMETGEAVMAGPIGKVISVF